MAADTESHEQLSENHLRERFAATVRKIGWSYAIFWSASIEQPGILAWCDGYYNGDIKTMKTSQPIEVKADLIGFQRSEQLRELYKSLSAVDSKQQTRRHSASLTPEDLTDVEWYYLVCMSFTFTLGQGLPGRAFVNNEYVWLSNAQFSESKFFSRSLLAKSASIQTVLSIPIMGGVLELGTTELILEDPALAMQISSFFWDLPVQICFEEYNLNLERAEDDQVHMFSELGDGINSSMALEDQILVAESQIPLENVPAHFPFTLHPYSTTEQTEAVHDKAEKYPANICKELNAGSPVDCSSDCFSSQQLEDLFDMVGLSSMPHPQNEQFIDDEVRNFLHGPFTNAQRVVSSTCGERIRNEMLDSLQDGSQSNIISLETDGGVSHYANTVATVLCKVKEVKPVSSCFLKVSHAPNFIEWRRGLGISTPLTGTSQKLLKKILIEREWFHNGCMTKPQERIELQDIVCTHGGHVFSERKRSEKLNEKFMILQSLVPSISKVDKASMLGDTIEYLKDLERRVEELESFFWDSCELDNKNSTKHPDVAERTSDNYASKEIVNGEKPLVNKRKASDITEVAEAEHLLFSSKETPIVDFNIIVKEDEVSVEMHCPWRECLLLEIVESISNLNLDPLSMQSSTIDGMLALTIKSKICLFCRQHGHSLKNCPEKSDTNKKKLCYNCGELGHSLSKCLLPLEDGGTKFASCFICNERGHLSKNCPKSTHGVYPKGGSCKICGEVTHLAKHCPSKGKKTPTTFTGQKKSLDALEEHQQGLQKIRYSGDDLEDDFLDESILGNKEGVSTNSKSASAMEKIVKNTHEKPKKQGPKIVNFLG